MRMMLRVMVDTAMGSEALKTGRLPQLIQALSEKIKPEAAYFSLQDGQRCGFFFFDMTDQTQMPSIAEPLYMELGAEIDLQPAMNFEDLAKGLQSM